jgi:hypothetical protein
LVLFALALPAQAGLGDLLDGLLEDPIEDLTAPLAPVVTALPLLPEVIETVEAAAAPIVTAVEAVASPVVTVVDEIAPITEVVEDVVDDPVPPVTTPNTTLPPVTTPTTTLPIPATTLPSATITQPTPSTTLPSVIPASFPAPIDDEPRPIRPNETVQARLLELVVALPVTPPEYVGDRGETRFIPADPVTTDWLAALGSWLGSGIASLLDVLALPAHLFELLLRALTSAGAGLVAPAAILAALAVGGRRRLLPVT